MKPFASDTPVENHGSESRNTTIASMETLSKLGAILDRLDDSTRTLAQKEEDKKILREHVKSWKNAQEVFVKTFVTLPKRTDFERDVREQIYLDELCDAVKECDDDRNQGSFRLYRLIGLFKDRVARDIETEKWMARYKIIPGNPPRVIHLDKTQVNDAASDQNAETKEAGGDAQRGGKTKNVDGEYNTSWHDWFHELTGCDLRDRGDVPPELLEHFAKAVKLGGSK